MSTPQDFQPAFKRVQQENDHDCALACIAMITGKTLAEVKQVAFDKNYLKHGPYWISEEAICKLLAHFGWVATLWKESTGLASIPDLAIGMVEYDPELEIGRHVLFHRQFAGTKQAVEYIIDPAYWVPVEKQVRVDIKGFPISWFIGVTQMNPPATGKK
ncbi:MAG: hypothetical protein H6R18_306 [Proteobacteria bacterium]|nr:hypothetical protein [Pseudomonadota bacterium]